MGLSNAISEIAGGDMLPPAKCIKCGVGGYDETKRFLDLKVDVDMEVETNDRNSRWEDVKVQSLIDGRLYFCMDCAREIGYEAGTVYRTDFDSLALANEILTKDNERLASLNKQMGDLLETDIIRTLLNRDNPSPIGPDLFSDSDVKHSGEGEPILPEHSVGTDSNESEPSGSGESEQSESTESIEDSRPNSISESTGSNHTSKKQSDVPRLEL